MPMGTRGWKWPAVGLVGLALVVLGAHLAWEQHRYRLRTLEGTIRIGMTKAEVEAALGRRLLPQSDRPHAPRSCSINKGEVTVQFDEGGRVTWASVIADGGTTPALDEIPRPSLFGHVRSWFGKRE
jgi:hypothetical protein